MPATYMGYEAKLYYGAAGATASTAITNSRDIKYDTNNVMGDNTIRGSGSAPPIRTGKPVAREVAMSWTMINKASDTTLTALLAAARTGVSVALRYIPNTGATGFDGDCFIDVSNGAPLGGEQTFDFTVSGIDNTTREPLLNS